MVSGNLKVIFQFYNIIGTSKQGNFWNKWNWNMIGSNLLLPQNDFQLTSGANLYLEVSTVYPQKDYLSEQASFAKESRQQRSNIDLPSMPPADAMNRLSIGIFFSICTQPTKVTQPSPLSAPESAATTTAEHMAASTSTPATRKPEVRMAAVEIATFDGQNAGICAAVVTPVMAPAARNTGGPRHTLVALGITAESVGSSRRCPVASPSPTPASHFQDFFGVPALSHPCGAQACVLQCGEYCGPALLEARCPYGADADARLYEILELLKQM